MAAIYMWRIGGEIIFTTTPYPIEATEGQAVSCELLEGGMWVWPEDELDVGFSMAGGELLQVLITAPYEEDFLDVGFSMPGGTLVEVLIVAPPEEDFLDVAMSHVDGELLDLLVTVYSPAQGVMSACELISGDLTTI